jgi:hypothetical protein
MGFFGLPTGEDGRVQWGQFLRRSVLVSIAVFIVIAPIADFVVSHSDAYEAARDRIVASRAVVARVGNVRSIKLSPWLGFSLNGRGGTRMHLKTKGDIGSMTIYVEMSQTSAYGPSHVKLASVDGVPISLD